MRNLLSSLAIQSTRRRIAFFILVLVLTFSLSLILSYNIRTISREGCWDMLKTSAKNAEDAVLGTFTNFGNALDNFINKQMYNVDMKSDAMREGIQKIRIGTIAAPIRLYLPDGYIITEDTTYERGYDLIDYASIESDTSFFSQLHEDFQNPESKIMELFVPVTRNGQIAAMASCVIKPEIISESVTTLAFSGQANVIAIDRRDGMIFLDNSQRESSSIIDYEWDDIDDGTSLAEFFGELMNGSEETRATFTSRKTGKTKYIYAVSSRLENISVAVEVDEDIAFERDKRVEYIIWNVLIIEVIIFSLFVIWMLVDSAKQVEKTRQKKEKEIKQIYEQDSVLYKKAVLNEAYSYFRVNLTKDRLIPPIIERIDGEAVDYTEKIGFPLPTYSQMVTDCADRYVAPEEKKDYMANFSATHLLDEYTKGNTMPQYVAKIHSSVIGWHYRKYIYYMTRDENTSEVNAMIVAYDITEELKYKKEEEEMQVIISTVSDDYESMALLNYSERSCIFYRLPVLVTGVDSAIAGFDNETEKIGAFANRFVFKEDRDRFCRDFNETVLMENTKNGRRFVQNYRIKTTAGPIWFQFKVVQPESFTLNRSYLVATRNINDEVQAQMKYQNELEKALTEAKSANFSKTQFLFNMSHDLRTPMNAVLGYADMVERNVRNPEKVGDFIRKLKSAGNQLTNIINDILEISRIESGQVLITPAPYDMRNCSNELKSVFTPLVEQKNQTMVVRTKVRDSGAMVDYAHLYRIIFNVLSNAIKYTPEGGEITYSIEQLEDLPDGRMQIMWKISDTGRGMSREYLSRIFERFSREKTTTESGIEGNGLGMALVKELVEKMSGTIEVESELGVGTTVTFIIPFERLTSGALENSKKKEVKSLNGMRVLLVEDIDLNREIACDMLENQGIVVTEAVNGQEAVDMIAASKPGDFDFVLMDIQMPVLDGYGATVKIRQLENKALANIPIIAMTANAFAEDRQRAMAAGMNEHIPKPVRLEELLDKISKCI